MTVSGGWPAGQAGSTLGSGISGPTAHRRGVDEGGGDRCLMLAVDVEEPVDSGVNEAEDNTRR